MQESLSKNLLNQVEQLGRPALVTLVKKFYRQKNFFQKILNLIRDGIVMINQNGGILSLNDAAKKMFNIQHKGEVIFWKCVPEILSQIDIAQIFSRSVATEISLSYPKKRIFQFYSIPFFDKEEPHVVCVFSDVTQKFLEKTKAIESSRIDSILLLSAGIAHEIGNPLNSISLQLELMKADLLEENYSRTEEAVQICRTEVERLRGIVKNFLQAVRPVQPNFTDVHLLELLNFTIKFLSPELIDAGVQVSFDVKGEVPVVLADIDQLKQVFFNIVKNAMEAMVTDKRLLIKLTSDEQDVILSFVDSGIGIAPEKIGTIFDPFATSKVNGNGLGMFIVQRILRDHGATITVESQENEGTTITVRFPRKFKSPKMLHVKDDNEKDNQ